jgi:protein-tyrosine phosphatase
MLVHCSDGVSRAPTLVIAYLMKFEGMGLQEAYSYCKKRHSRTKPNQGFMLQLRKFEKHLLAEGGSLGGEFQPSSRF